MKLTIVNSDIDEINATCVQIAKHMRNDIHGAPEYEAKKINNIWYKGFRMRNDTDIEIAQIVMFAGIQSNGQSICSYRVFVR